MGLSNILLASPVLNLQPFKSLPSHRKQPYLERENFCVLLIFIYELNSYFFKKNFHSFCEGNSDVLGMLSFSWRKLLPVDNHLEKGLSWDNRTCRPCCDLLNFLELCP